MSWKTGITSALRMAKTMLGMRANGPSSRTAKTPPRPATRRARTAAASPAKKRRRKPSLSQLVKRLQSADPELREQAARKLGACVDPTVPPLLVKVLRDPQPSVQKAAVRSLDKLGWKADNPRHLAWYMIVNKKYRDVPAGNNVDVRHALLLAARRAFADPQEEPVTLGLIEELGRTADAKAAALLVGVINVVNAGGQKASWRRAAEKGLLALGPLAVADLAKHLGEWNGCRFPDRQAQTTVRALHRTLSAILGQHLSRIAMSDLAAVARLPEVVAVDFYRTVSVDDNDAMPDYEVSDGRVRIDCRALKVVAADELKRRGS